MSYDKDLRGLVLKRPEGSLLSITDRISGRKILIKVYHTRNGSADLLFVDKENNFQIDRAERIQ